MSDDDRRDGNAAKGSLCAKSVGAFAGWIVRFIALFVLAVVCVAVGGAIVASALPADAATEPGLVSPVAGLLLLALTNLLVVAALVLSSRWTGWRLALVVGTAYYGTVTVLMQLETGYFLSGVTVGPQLLLRLFLMGLPTAVFLVPAAVWLLRKPNAAPRRISLERGLPAQQWVWKLALIAVVYVTLYWSAGYFIAWKNPELRAFYGRPGPPLPFLAHTADTLRNDPLLLPFQLLRSQLWVAFAFPIIRGSRWGPWSTALLVGLLFSLPQNVGLLMANPLMPLASVRQSHLIETASSTFLFGMIVVWLLHRAHRSPRDLFGRQPIPALTTDASRLSRDTARRSGEPGPL